MMIIDIKKIASVCDEKDDTVVVTDSLVSAGVDYPLDFKIGVLAKFVDVLDNDLKEERA